MVGGAGLVGLAWGLPLCSVSKPKLRKTKPKSIGCTCINHRTCSCGYIKLLAVAQMLYVRSADTDPAQLQL